MTLTIYKMNTEYITYCNPVRDCSSVETVETTTASHPLHPVGMQAIADYVASLQDAGSWEGHPFLPNYHPYGMNTGKIANIYDIHNI
ncbi:hypothetical protein FACS189430_10230 [Bacteroidia bacterium]|nr:hypothetical protein FACS189430_10230 [Bacteroidia bacterium]